MRRLIRSLCDMLMPASHAPLLRRLDQAAVGAIVMLSLVAVGVYWFLQGDASGRLIEIDRAAPQTARFTVDVNEADWTELAALPGVGETLARRIVEFRQAEGPFVDLEQLERVRGIGPRTLDRVRPYLRPIPAAADTAGR